MSIKFYFHCKENVKTITTFKQEITIRNCTATADSLKQPEVLPYKNLIKNFN